MTVIRPFERYRAALMAGAAVVFTAPAAAQDSVPGEDPVAGATDTGIQDDPAVEEATAARSSLQRRNVRRRCRTCPSPSV
jgi:hypothetical protein